MTALRKTPVNMRQVMSVIAIVALAACGRDIAAPAASTPAEVSLGKATSSTDMTVSAVSPDSATQDTTLDVVITGSGFVAGTAATWSMSGVSDPAQIRTNSTAYVNSRKLIANVTISSTATVGAWDIVVTASGKKGGIGTEKFTVRKAFAPPNPAPTWTLPLNVSGLGLVSDGRFPDASNSYSLYENGVCAVITKLFYYDGSGDATVQTNNPREKSRTCPARQMSVVYPAGDVVYPDGGVETMPVFLNVRNIANDTTTIAIGSTVERMLALNPSQTERCDAWRWATVAGGDDVLVNRIDASTYHVFTKDRGPNPVPGANRAICTTTGQEHHLSVDLYVVSNVALR